MDKHKIKIVKKAEISQPKKAIKRATSTRNAARAVVSNVSGWVADLKVRKSEETRAAFDLLFQATQPATK